LYQEQKDESSYLETLDMIRMVSRTNVTDTAYYYNLGIAESKLDHKASALANLQKAADLYQE
jgi:hypothetical protein